MLLHTPWLKRALFHHSLGHEGSVWKTTWRACALRDTVSVLCVVLHDQWDGSVVATRLVVPAVARERSTMNQSTDLMHPAVRAESIKRDTWLASKAKR